MIVDTYVKELEQQIFELKESNTAKQRIRLCNKIELLEQQKVELEAKLFFNDELIKRLLETANIREQQKAELIEFIRHMKYNVGLAEEEEWQFDAILNKYKDGE